MKLLFDQMLSPALVRAVADLFPGSSHVRDVGLERASDRDVWEFARQQGYLIVTKDNDFDEFSVLEGHPPKVVWIRRGNCPTRTVADLLRASEQQLRVFEVDDSLAVLMLL